MKKVLILLCFVFSFLFGSSQSLTLKDAAVDDRGLISVVFRYPDGKQFALDYLTVKEFNQKFENYTYNGEVFKDSKGQTYPIIYSKTGKKFIFRTSKNGKVYKQYLK